MRRGREEIFAHHDVMNIWIAFLFLHFLEDTSGAYGLKGLDAFLEKVEY
jgi:hypothetical protein